MKSHGAENIDVWPSVSDEDAGLQDIEVEAYVDGKQRPSLRPSQKELLSAALWGCSSGPRQSEAFATVFGLIPNCSHGVRDRGAAMTYLVHKAFFHSRKNITLSNSGTKHFFPKSHGRPRVDDRRVLSSIIFVNRSGLRWRDAPREYGPHKTLYNRWKRWGAMGIFAPMMIDATYLKTHRTASSL